MSEVTKQPTAPTLHNVFMTLITARNSGGDVEILQEGIDLLGEYMALQQPKNGQLHTPPANSWGPTLRGPLGDPRDQIQNGQSLNYDNNPPARHTGGYCSGA